MRELNEAKKMKPNFRKTIRISKLQSKHHMAGQAFNPGGTDKNRHWLGGYWFDVNNFDNENDMNTQRQAYIERLRNK